MTTPRLSITCAVLLSLLASGCTGKTAPTGPKGPASPKPYVRATCPPLLARGSLDALPVGKLVRVAGPKGLGLKRLFPREDGFFALDAEGRAYSWGSAPNKACSGPGEGLRRLDYMGTGVSHLMARGGSPTARTGNKGFHTYLIVGFRDFASPRLSLEYDGKTVASRRSRRDRHRVYLLRRPLTLPFPRRLSGSTLTGFFAWGQTLSGRWASLDPTGRLQLWEQRGRGPERGAWRSRTPGGVRGHSYSALVQRRDFLLLADIAGNLFTLGASGRKSPASAADNAALRETCFDKMVQEGTVRREKLKRLRAEGEKYVSRSAVAQFKMKVARWIALQREFAVRLRTGRKLDARARALHAKIRTLREEIDAESHARQLWPRRAAKKIRAVMSETREHIGAPCLSYRLPLGEVPRQVNLRGKPRIATLSQWGKAACALTVDQRLYCFNLDCPVQLGGRAIGAEKSLRFRSVHPGPERVCAVTTTGRLLCFPRAYLGYDGPEGTIRTRGCQLPYDLLSFVLTDLPAPPGGVRDMVMARSHLCLLDGAGYPWCLRWSP